MTRTGHTSIRRERHAQNNNKGADLFQAILMILARQRDGYRAVHNAVIANAWPWQRDTPFD